MGANSFNQELNHRDTSSVTNMSYMFLSASAFNQDRSNWNVSSAKEMLRSRGVSTSNYDSLLLNWSSQSILYPVNFGAQDITYSSSSQEARDILTEDFGWSIHDGGVEPLEE